MFVSLMSRREMAKQGHLCDPLEGVSHYLMPAMMMIVVMIALTIIAIDKGQLKVCRKM